MNLEHRLMQLTGSLLLAIAVALLLFSGWLWLLRLPLWDIKGVRLQEPSTRVQDAALARALSQSLQGNFITADLRQVRERVALTPWVRQVRVQRQWPGRLLLNIEEQRPFAYWGEERLLNTYGEVFDASVADLGEVPLPRLDGPAGSEQRVKQGYSFFQSLVNVHGAQLQALALEPLENWRLTLDDDLVLMLHDAPQAELRQVLERYFKLVPAVRKQYGSARLKRVDLRYPNGFAVEFAGVQVAPKPQTGSTNKASNKADAAAAGTVAKPHGKDSKVDKADKTVKVNKSDKAAKAKVKTGNANHRPKLTRAAPEPHAHVASTRAAWPAPHSARAALARFTQPALASEAARVYYSGNQHGTGI